MQVIRRGNGHCWFRWRSKLKEEKAHNCASSIIVSLAFINIVVYGHEERLKQSNVSKITFGEMSPIM